MPNAAQTAQAYKQQQIMTATPEGLTLMLYNGALKFIAEGIDAMQKKQYEQCNNALLRAENIVSEFRATLKMEYEVSHGMMALYNYVYDCLVEGNMKEDVRKLEEAKEIMTELRNTWHEAMKIARAERSVTQ